MKIKITEKIEYDWELAMPYPEEKADGEKYDPDFQVEIEYELLNVMEEFLSEEHIWVSRVQHQPYIQFEPDQIKRLKDSMVSAITEHEVDYNPYSGEELEYWLKDFDLYKADIIDLIGRWAFVDYTEINHNDDECDAEVQY